MTMNIDEIRGVVRESAENLVAYASENFQIALDYKPDSLGFIDAFLLKAHEEAVEEEKLAGLLQAMGCYTGEVLIRNLDGDWMYHEEFETVAVRLPSPDPEDKDGITLFPLQKVHKLLRNGEEDNLMFFFESISNISKNGMPPAENA